MTCFFLLLTTCSWGQRQEYRTNATAFTTEDGLSHFDVYCFEKDNKGVLWVGTRDGLNRFDGRRFKVFTKKNGLVHKSINALYQDKDFLWCIHHDRTKELDFVSIFHTKEEKVYSLKEYLGSSLPFQETDIQNIRKVNNVLIITTQNYKKYSYTSEKGLQNLSFLKNEEEIVGIAENGDLWVLDLGKKYLFLRRINKEGRGIFLAEKKDSNVIGVDFIHQKENGTAYFAYISLNQNEILYSWLRVDKKGNVTIEAPINWTEIIATYCTYYPKYDIYFYIKSNNFALLDMKRNVLYKNISNVREGPDLFFDNTIIWVRTTNGFSEIEVQKNKFTNVLTDHNYSFRKIIKIDSVIYAFSDVIIFGSTTNFETHTEHPFSFSSVTALEDGGSLWGFELNRLVQYNSKFEETTFSFDLKHDTSSKKVWSMYKDKNGLIWYSDMGLTSFNPTTQELKKLTSKEFPEIEKSIVYHFYEKGDGNILLCTTTGLYEMQLGKGIIARYWSGGEGKYSLPTDDFRHLYFEKSTQSYWLATNEAGLIHWNPETNTSKSYTFNHRATNIIHAVYADDFGFLWLSTENGIIQFEKKTGNFKTYLPKDGTSTHEFNRISHFQDDDGKIFFGGIKGITFFDPKDFYKDFNSLENTKIIPVEISQYKKEEKKVQNVTADFYQHKEVNFYPNDRFLTFIFGLNNYRYSKDAVYYYKLKEVDADWTITKDNEITISGMPYGTQILEVKVLLENGKFTREHLEITIKVHRPFYLQWWFFVLSFLLIVGITLLYIRYSTKNLELQKIALEKEVKKRTLEIEKDKEIIEQDKEIIEKQAEKLIELDKVKTRFFANVSHELRTPITLIKAPIQSVIKSQTWNERNDYLLKKASKNTDNLLSLVNEILDLTKIDNQKLKLEEEKVLFYTFIRQTLSNFQSIAQMQNIEMVLNYLANKDLHILLDKNKFQKILNNLLSNSLKFTPEKGKITITIEDLADKMLLKVADTGRGIPQEDVPRVFERYFQSSQNNKAEGGLGIGLALSMELVKLCKGKMWLKSSTKPQNKGTTFFVEFPKREVLTSLSTEDVLSIENDFSRQKTEKIRNKKAFLNTKAEKTILIVEDNTDLREYLSFALSAYYKVLTAENGQKAVDLLSNGQVPNLIISDLMMPIMDGYEFLEAVKNNKKWAGLPFIMLTARVARQDRLKALRIGVDDYITKPFEEEELLVRVANLLTNYQEKIDFIQAEQKTTPNSNQNKRGLNFIKEDREWLADFEKLVLKKISSSLFSVDYLAELLGINRITLYNKIKKFTGLTPNQYIKIIRLALSKELLEQRKYKTVKEVAENVGLKNTTYFSKLFEQEYGKSPYDYLKPN